MNAYHPNILLARIATFEKTMPSNRRLADDGRLTLLRDAITKGDWFYIVLSQIHALADRPDSRPDAMNKLSPVCWKYIDNLLCSNTSVSPGLLRFLGDFPAPTMKLYSDPMISNFYGNLINEVAAFVQQLPKHWDVLANLCRQLDSPPLAQDMWDMLSLRSLVLQTVAFTALTRMIFNHDSLKFVVDIFVALHRLDQRTCTQRRRELPEKEIAYRAFGKVGDMARFWVQSKQQHDMAQQHLAQKTQFPPFVLKDCCPDVIAFFEGRQAQMQPVGQQAGRQNFTSQQQQQQQQQHINPPTAQQTPRTPNQQYQAIVSNDQMMRQQQMRLRQTQVRFENLFIEKRGPNVGYVLQCRSTLFSLALPLGGIWLTLLSRQPPIQQQCHRRLWLKRLASQDNSTNLILRD